MIYHFPKFLIPILFSFFFFVLSTAYTQDDRPVVQALIQLDEFQEVYISMEVSSFLLDLAAVASIDYFDNNRVYLYANHEAFQLLKNSDIGFRLERRPGLVDFELNMLDAVAVLEKDLTQNWDFYPDYDAYVALMYHFETLYPQLVKIHNIGSTVQGRALLFAQIGPGAGQERSVPQFMYTSTMHGDETAGFVILLRLIHHLISNYGISTEITSLMDEVEIWICPNENPDGTYTNNNATINGATRANANGVDLNRNYPTPHPNPSSPPITPIQPETQAMMDFVSDKNFIMSANIHGGIELVNFPFDSWNSTEKKHVDHNWWEFVMTEFVDTIHTYSDTGYMTGRVTGITHGGDWYVIYGGRQDYMNYYHSCREFTFEISGKKALNPELLPAHWEYNYRSLINYIRQATYGFHGFVKDAGTGQPLFASIELVGHDEYYSKVTSITHHGNFSRPTVAGIYDLKFVTDDYPDLLMPQVIVENHQRVDLNIFPGTDPQALYVYNKFPGSGVVKGSGIYPSGYTVQLEALPNKGFAFLHWINADGDVLSEEQNYTFEMPASSTTLFANFAPADFLLSVSVSNENAGEVIVTPVGDSFSFGETITLAAYPFQGYMFNAWVDDNDIALSQYDTYSFTMPARDVSVVAVFEVLSDISGFDYMPGVRVYPNPARDHLTIEADFEIKGVELYDERGRMVTQMLNITNNVFNIPLMTINPGFYMLRIYGQMGWVTRKIQVFQK